jgi:hypothetical protein
VFVRPCRSATLRSRLDREEIRERLATLAADPPPDGAGLFFAQGFFLGGTVKFNSAKNPQTYSVQGRLEESRDWRLLRLRLTAHARWVSPWELGAIALFLGLYVYFGEISVGTSRTW